MAHQITLFDLLKKQKDTHYISMDIDDCFPSSRNSDPETSKEASESVDFRESHFIKIWEALETPLGKDGISQKTGLSGVQIARRLHEMRKMRLIEHTGNKVKSNSGRNEMEYRRIENIH